MVIPFLVPFIIRDGGYSELQTARMLSAFAPGYVLTQIPGGWLVKRFGANLVVTAASTCVGTVLLLLPTAGRAGSWAVCATFSAIGMVQGPYMAAAAVVQSTVMPAVGSAQESERPLAQMIIRFGQQAAKLLVAAVTPWVATRWGWAAFPRLFGAFVLASTVGFAAVAPESRPQPPRKKPAAARRLSPETRDVSILRMVFSLPTQALIWNQCCHDLMEQHVIGAWGPIYYSQAPDQTQTLGLTSILLPYTPFQPSLLLCHVV